MTSVFVGGSRQVSRLGSQERRELQRHVEERVRFLVGDANGADKAVQKWLCESKYENVVVFCSGDACRNNLGRWETRNIGTGRRTRDYAFYAAKDREMARECESGLMIWDGLSVGTILNVLRLVRAEKEVLLMNVRDEDSILFEKASQWDRFIDRQDEEFRSELRKRSLPEEWKKPAPQAQASLF